MKPGNKRPDAWYASLPDMDMWAAYDVCVRLRPWQRAAAWIKEKHGLKVNRSAYYRWLDWCRDNCMEHTLRDAHRFSQETKQIVKSCGNIDTTLQEGVAALALDAASSRDMDSLGRLVRGLGQLRRTELETAKATIIRLEQRITELEKQTASAPASAALSDEERSSKIKGAFGVA